MMACSSWRLSITAIPCFVEALQRIFSRYLILGYPREKRGSTENHYGLGKSTIISKGGLQTEKFFPASPPPPTQGGRKPGREF